MSSIAARPLSPAAAAPSFDGAWRRATAVAILAIAVVDIRLHEGVPFLWKFRLALVSAFGGTALILWKSHPEVVRRALRDPLLHLALMYLGWAAVSVPFGLWWGNSVNGLRAFIPAILTQFLILVCPTDRSALHKLLRGTVVAAAMCGILSMALGRQSGEGRLSGVGSFDANDLAAIMALTVPIALGMMARSRDVMAKAFYGACTAVVVVTMAATASRGGVIAILVAMFVYIIGLRGGRRWLYLALGILGGFATWTTATPEFRSRTTELFSGVKDYNYTDYGGRKMIWARGRMYVRQNPILGVGIGNFPVAEGEECRRRRMGGCKWSAPHNAYVQSAAELGVPGFLIFCALLVQSARSAFKLWRKPRSRPADGRAPLHLPELLAALCGFAAAAVFLSFAYFFMLFGLVGLIGLARRVQSAELEAAPQALRADPRALAMPVRAAGMRGGLARVGRPA